MGIEQKVAIITGASQGIGAALVQGFRDRNYRVVATARSIKPSSDDEVLAVAGDIADRSTAERVVSQAIARFGRIDTLVNNAGIFVAKPFTQYTAKDYAAVMGTNVAGFFNITQLAIAEMEKQGSGHVVQITTTLVDQANSNVPSVLASLSKGGLNAATKSLAIEYARRGIRVNAVSPGIIKSPMHPVATAARAPATERRRTTMPIVTIQVTREGTAPGAASLTAEEKAALIKGSSELLRDVLGKPLESTFVVIEEVDTDNWGWGGVPVQEFRRRRATQTG